MDGPRRPPRAAKATDLIVLLHGFGADGNDLIALADEWAPRLPRTAFVAPNATDRIPGQGFSGLQWFDLTFRDPHELWHGASRAAPPLGVFLNAELDRLGLPHDRLALVGFSQGAMMALHVGLRRAMAPAAIVAFSGVIAGPEHLRAEMRSRPPVLLVHGDQDPVIPIEALEVTRESLGKAAVPVEWHVRPGLGHGIDHEALRLAGSFLRAALNP